MTKNEEVLSKALRSRINLISEDQEVVNYDIKNGKQDGDVWSVEYEKNIQAIREGLKLIEEL